MYWLGGVRWQRPCLWEGGGDGEGERGGGSLWEAAEGWLLEGGRMGLSCRKGPTCGPRICQTKEVTG